jgi:hypothetical protein
MDPHNVEFDSLTDEEKEKWRKLAFIMSRPVKLIRDEAERTKLVKKATQDLTGLDFFVDYSIIN